MKRYLSGIQPSGLPHLGNYFGAILPHIERSKSEDESLFFIADLHSLTTFKDKQSITEQVQAVACTYLALGLDLDNAVLFRQSDVPEVTELSWMLACATSTGLLFRAHSYKDKIDKGLTPNAGLYTYPVLMAADILIYNSTHVPVGQDQKQHVEMAQDMARFFNTTFNCDVLRYPEPEISEQARIIGTDGQKMSKSYGNTIPLFLEGQALKSVVGKIVTDSRRPEDPKDPDDIALFQILQLFLSPEEKKEMEQRIRNGGSGAPGYGEMKNQLINLYSKHFIFSQKRYKELRAHMASMEVEKILMRGAERARALAKKTLSECYDAAGIVNRR